MNIGRYESRGENGAALGMVPSKLHWIKSRKVCLEAISPDDHSEIITQGILSEYCLNRWNGAELGWWLKRVPSHLVLSCFKRALWTFTVTNVVTCQYKDLVVSPLVVYALSLDILIRQINLAQSWREWLLPLQ